MAAKGALSELLRDQSKSTEDLVQETLLCAKKHKLSVKYLSRLAQEFLQVDSLDLDSDPTVESLVRAMVEHSRTMRLDAHNDKDLEEMVFVGTPNSCDWSAEDGSVSSNSRTGLDNNQDGDEEESLAEGKASNANKATSSTTGQSVRVLRHDSADASEQKLFLSTSSGISQGEALSVDAMENACFPKSLFSLLISKIDSLTFTVQSQRGELLDVERRLKNEFKSREKVQLDQIASLEKKIVENGTYNNRTNSVRRNSRTEHIEKSSKRLDSGFGKEKVRGNGYSQEKKNVLGADQTEKSESSARESQETKVCSENDPKQPTERDEERSRSLLESIQLQQSTKAQKKKYAEGAKSYGTLLGFRRRG